VRNPGHCASAALLDFSFWPTASVVQFPRARSEKGTKKVIEEEGGAHHLASPGVPILLLYPEPFRFCRDSSLSIEASWPDSKRGIRRTDTSFASLTFHQPECNVFLDGDIDRHGHSSGESVYEWLGRRAADQCPAPPASSATAGNDVCRQ